MELILRLKEFYLLELLQLKMYQSQLGSLQDEYLRAVYERMIQSERRHVTFYEQLLMEHQQKIPSIPGGVTSLVGMFLGEAADITSAKNRYKLGAAVENKAIEMYRALILETADRPDLQKGLWHNMIDEEFHLLWFKDNQKQATTLVKST
ncbi:ferritin-like domain-containing protein [Metallumcola ferriviriculae]|uniref:Ferritin-like domain-containing protein n=1 Tax=Metallumcola ferriviriculae TaxID=3039180 RepID=A0AAU0UKF3_9FIRM|nr:ferritin-like domain-containing protein [Desulfitibacteraceae bacterium MK1]